MAAVTGFAGPRAAKWEPVSRTPTEAQLAKLPPGTAFTYAKDLPMGHRQFIHVKLGDDRWLRCAGVTLDDAVAQWAKLARKPPAESSGYYHRGWDTWYDLKDSRKTLQRLGVTPGRGAGTG
jgi:hypothetical protein